MTSHVITVLFEATLTLVTSLAAAATAGYLARRDRATYPQAVTRAAAAFAATLTLGTGLVATWTTLAR
ncbi:hypothetical protein KDL01_05810 [Actinospica durhamensis]|uniref:Uncharacterized protein n=1 Tax=Actinospica durhamensis TaxID=1508375 RepID=A0A941IS03_9ACTN|nr:hypothetical protein [Actinospica durhamensis]MBR7832766.1 hypothetical protein [Actinospica durhamensis]